ncbi:hypothetical protein J4E90_010061 [Alternaria incomplexa]|uniref:uncharacterized protein n=1 Tax=Alternaria incomplexa TaxID=1187928 RepID=UPI002220AE49|nr:uncharacterized protein J4E90_010061 [Alternaria incomplexa]KAI4906858.1 hypothetical protein J4E90_010061 [Alternaria incomplexa]
MFALSIRSITNSRVVGPLAIFALSTQTRTLYFCGPKQGDHDADLPISEHYHARLRASADVKPRSTADLAPPTTTPTRPTPPPPTQPTTTTDTIPTLRISVTHAPPSLSARHTLSPANKVEYYRKAFGQMEAATRDGATDYNNTLAIIQEIARLQFELRRGQVEGKPLEELEKVRRDIEDLRCVFERIGRRWGI